MLYGEQLFADETDRAGTDAKGETYRVSLRDGMFPEMEKASSGKVALSGEVTPETALLLAALASGISSASIFWRYFRY